jgi:hypothetical protein
MKNTPTISLPFSFNKKRKQDYRLDGKEYKQRENKRCED